MEIIKSNFYKYFTISWLLNCCSQDQNFVGTSSYQFPQQQNTNLLWIVIAVNLSSEVAWSQTAKFMGPTWGPPGSCRPQMGPMLAPWTLLSGLPLHGWVTVTTNRSYHQPRWRRPKTVRPNNRGYQENLTVRCAHMTLTCRCHITLCISAMTMCFSSAGSENLHLEIFRKLVVTVRPCWS